MSHVCSWLSSSLLAALFLSICGSAPAAEEAAAIPVKLFPYCEAGKWGYINVLGEVIVTPRFRQARDFNEGRGRVSDEKSRSYLNEEGKTAFTVPDEWERAGNFAEGLAVFSENDKFGYFDRDGKIVVAPKYDDADSFSEGLAAVNVGAKMSDEFPRSFLKGGKWGFIDKSGRLVIPIQFNSVEYHGFSNGLAQVHADGPFTYIDKTGNAVIKLEYKSDDPKRFIHSASRFSDGLAAVSTSAYEGAYSGFIDKTGKFAIKPQFEFAGDFSEGLAAVGMGKKTGHVDRTGRTVAKPLFEGARGFREGLAAVLSNKAWRFIDKKGNVVVPPPGKQDATGPFNDVEDFSGGLARVHVGGEYERTNDGPCFWTGGTWLYVNRKGEIVRRCMRDVDGLPGSGGPSYGKAF